MEKDVLLKEICGKIGILKLNRPEKGNSLSLALLADLHLTLREWAADDRLRVVVITGNSETAFSSGYDILSIPTQMRAGAAEFLKSKNPLELALKGVRDFPYPVIAMINGYCFGAGLNLAMCCDIRIAADHIKAGMPPVRLGLVYHPDGLSQFIEVIGMARTREIFLTGRTYAGPEVREMGLADHLVPKERLSETVFQLAGEIANNAPLALRGTKKILNRIGKSLRMGAEYREEADSLIAEAMNSQDLKEGQAAFMEKRDPVFTGS